MEPTMEPTAGEMQAGAMKIMGMLFYWSVLIIAYQRMRVRGCLPAGRKIIVMTLPDMAEDYPLVVLGRLLFARVYLDSQSR